MVEVTTDTGSPLRIGEGSILFDGADSGTHAVEWDGVRWDRRTASSPWVHGDVLVGARKTNSTLTMSLWLQGSSHDDVRALWDTLAEAFGQFTYPLTLWVGSTEYRFTGLVADMSLGFARNHLWTFNAPARLSVPVMPIGVL